MSYKFNTDKLNIMKSLHALVKFFITSFIFIFFLSSLIQTATFVQISVKGTYDVTGADGGGKSGVVYLTTLGPNSDGTSYGGTGEQNWAEIVNTGNDQLEEMDEDVYDLSDWTTKKSEDHCRGKNCYNAFDKYTWETSDSWESRMKKHRGKITGLARLGHTNVFEPKAGDAMQTNFFLGFNLNPELLQLKRGDGDDPDDIKEWKADSEKIGSRYKEHPSRNGRAGFGLFLVASPYPGHFIKQIDVRAINDTSGGFIKFKSPNSSPSCNKNSCELDFDNDFTHEKCRKKTYKNVDVGWDGDQNFYKQGWFGGMDGTKYCFSKNRTENSDVY